MSIRPVSSAGTPGEGVGQQFLLGLRLRAERFEFAQFLDLALEALVGLLLLVDVAPDPAHLPQLQDVEHEDEPDDTDAGERHDAGEPPPPPRRPTAPAGG